MDQDAHFLQWRSVWGSISEASKHFGGGDGMVATGGGIMATEYAVADCDAALLQYKFTYSTIAEAS